MAKVTKKTTKKAAKKATKKVVAKGSRKIEVKQVIEKPKKQKTGGRKKGTANKKSCVLNEVLESLEYDPLAEIINTLRTPTYDPEKIGDQYSAYIETLPDECLKAYEYKSLKEFTKDVMNNQLSPKEKIDANFKLLKYIYPTKKAIEVKTIDKTVKTFNLGYSNAPADLDESFLEDES
ncbi:MAG: hypothetical protein ACPGJV_02680 [Bacteriovoracaceae bacterium]